MRGRHTCRLCSTRKSVPVANCSWCGAATCQRHITWSNDEWLCTKCERGRGNSGNALRDAGNDH